MVQVVCRQTVTVEFISAVGNLCRRHIQRRAIQVGRNLYEFRWRGMRCYAKMVNGELVCSDEMRRQWSYPYHAA